MAAEHLFEGITHVVSLSTDEGKGCEHCDTQVGSEDFTGSINHYIEQHGYKLLFIGQESSRDYEGNPWQIIVAIVGK
jgi:hypothetical protein